jgi:hypothetical protein
MRARRREPREYFTSSAHLSAGCLRIQPSMLGKDEFC